MPINIYFITYALQKQKTEENRVINRMNFKMLKKHINLLKNDVGKITNIALLLFVVIYLKEELK